MARYDPTLVELTISLFILCTNMNVCLKIIHNVQSLAQIFMKGSAGEENGAKANKPLLRSRLILSRGYKTFFHTQLN